MKKKPPPVSKKSAKPAAAPPKRTLPQMPPTPDNKPTEPKVSSFEIAHKAQVQTFDKGMALFHKQEFGKAQEFFARAADGPVVEMAHAAQMHLRMCERRIKGTNLVLKTPEDNYNYGVALMNQRKLEEADPFLAKAVNGAGRVAHYHYALALCRGLRGDLTSAAEHLRRAIEIEPGNRIAALNDVEFQAIAGHAPIREVLHAERSGSG